MKIWLEIIDITLLRGSAANGGPFVKYLWLPVELQVIPPIGSTIWAPDPGIEAFDMRMKVVDLIFVGSTITCVTNIDDDVMLDDSVIRKLLSIGYLDQQPAELDAAYNALTIKPTREAIGSERYYHA